METVEKQSESVDNLTDTVNKQTESEEEEVETAEKGTVTEETEQNVTHRSPHIIHPVHFSQDLHNGDVHLEVLAIPSGGRLPSAHPEKHGTIQELSASESWNFCPDGEIVDVKEKKKAYSRLSHRDGHWFKEIVKPENYCFECIPDSMSTKVGRQAGRMPNGTQSASSQVLRMSRKQTEYFKHAPPLRTPPSIPSASHRQSQFIDQSPRYGQTYSSEIEHHARSTRSPRHYMEQGNIYDKDVMKVQNCPRHFYLSSIHKFLQCYSHVRKIKANTFYYFEILELCKNKQNEKIYAQIKEL